MRVNNSFRYQLLEQLGISYWIPRQDPSAFFIADKPVFCAATLVLLAEKIEPTAIAQQKILQGMLSVLGVNDEDIGVAWLKNSAESDTAVNKDNNNTVDTAPNAVKNRFADALLKWAPQSVLLMGIPAGRRLLGKDELIDETDEELRSDFHLLPGMNIPIQITYHPKELAEHPDNKRKAFQDLLKLKEYLQLQRIPEA